MMICPRCSQPKAQLLGENRGIEICRACYDKLEPLATDARKGLIELGWFGDMPPADPLAASSQTRDRLIRWLRDCQELLAEPDEVPELEALIASLAASSSPAPKLCEHWRTTKLNCDEFNSVVGRTHQLLEAIELALTFHQTTHIHAILRDALNPPLPPAPKEPT